MYKARILTIKNSNRDKKFLFSVFANSGVRLLGFLTSLIIIPLVLKSFGTANYGVYAVFISLGGYLTTLDFGISNALQTELAQAAGGKKEISRGLIASGLMVSLCTVVLLVCASILSQLWGFYQVTADFLFSDQSGVTRDQLFLFSTLFLIFNFLNFPQSIFNAYQLGWWPALAQAVVTVITFAGSWLAANTMKSFSFLVLTIPIAQIVGSAVLWIIYLRQSAIPLIELSQVSADSVRSLISRSLSFFWIQLISVLAFQTDTILVAKMLSATDAAAVAAHGRLIFMASGLFSLIAAPLWPAYGDAFGRGDHAWIRRTLAMTVIYSLIISGIFGAMLVIFGPQIFSLWLKDSLSFDRTIMVPYSAWLVLVAVGTMLAMWMNGCGKVKFQAYAGFFFVILATAAKILVVPRLGAGGMLWAANISYLICVLVPVSVLIYRSNIYRHKQT